MLFLHTLQLLLFHLRTKIAIKILQTLVLKPAQFFIQLFNAVNQFTFLSLELQVNLLILFNLRLSHKINFS